VPGLLSAQMGEGSARMKNVLDLHGGVNWSSAKLEEWYESPLSGSGEADHMLRDRLLLLDSILVARPLRF
jgi:hypothetical protein